MVDTRDMLDTQDMADTQDVMDMTDLMKVNQLLHRQPKPLKNRLLRLVLSMLSIQGKLNHAERNGHFYFFQTAGNSGHISQM